MRTIKRACSTAFMITVACLVLPAAAQEPEQALPAQGEVLATEDEPVDDTTGSMAGEAPAVDAVEEAPVEEPAMGEAPVEDVLAEEGSAAVERLESSPSRATAAAVAPPPQMLALAAPPPAVAPPPPVVLEDPSAFRRRIADARKLAAEQRKRVLIEAVPEGLSPAELEIRAAEKNIAIYDKQIEMGQGTHAIEAFRRLALDTLAKLRRTQFVKVWGDALEHAEAPGVLREHAQRMAELRRIRFLADVKSYSGLVRRTDELMVKEKSRFEKSMQVLHEAQAKANGAANMAQAVPAQP